MKPGALANLSETECHILREVAEGKTNRQIGETLGLATGTVKNYVADLMRKLACDNRAALAAFATANNLQGTRYWEDTQDLEIVLSEMWLC